MDSRNTTSLIKEYWEGFHIVYDVYFKELRKRIGPFYSYRQAVSYCNSTNGTKLKETDDD